GGWMSRAWPLAIRWPRMLETLPPVTRLSATEFRPGWMNCTVEPAGIPKALQVMIVLFVVCVMTDLVAEGVLSVAPPDCTWKPDSPLEVEPAAAPLPPPASAATSAVVAKSALQKARVDGYCMFFP